MIRRKRPIRTLQVVSQANRFPFFEWLARGLDRERFELAFVFLKACPEATARGLAAEGIAFDVIAHAGQHGLPGTARRLAEYCRARSVDVIHTHFMDACLAGLVGARRAGVGVRIHTRHHAGPYPADHRPVWGALYDRWNNWHSTAIVAPSLEARRALVNHDGVAPQKVVVIPHGFDLEAFRNPAKDDVARIRRRYGIASGGGPVIGVVARYERIKGVEHAIPAFRNLLKTHAEARLVLANPRGRRSAVIRRLLATLPAGCYTEIAFEDDMPALYSIFDVLVHAPIHPSLEAFGQVYVEAMAAGVPCVCTKAGIAQEYVDHQRNAFVVAPEDPEAILRGLLHVLSAPGVRGPMTVRARQDVEERFSIDRMIRALEDLYMAQCDGSGGEER